MQTIFIYEDVFCPRLRAYPCLRGQSSLLDQPPYCTFQCRNTSRVSKFRTCFEFDTFDRIFNLFINLESQIYIIGLTVNTEYSVANAGQTHNYSPHSHTHSFTATAQVFTIHNILQTVNAKGHDNNAINNQRPWPCMPPIRQRNANKRIFLSMHSQHNTTQANTVTAPALNIRLNLYFLLTFRLPISINVQKE